MCMNLDFLKALFGKKEEPQPTEEEIVEETISNEETIPEEQQEQIAKPEPEEQPSFGSSATYSDSNLVILLDNGHAKSTPGKRGPKFPDGSRFFEWEFNRDVVKRVAAGLDKLGIKYHILVPEDEKDIVLSERARRANEYCNKYGTKNCFFISVHSNAFGNGEQWETPGGWSVYTTVGVTKSDEYGKVMYEVAEEMLKPYGFKCRDGKGHGAGNEGPDYEENFTVIYKTWCPAILTENLFFTNEKESTFLMTDTGRQVIADIHVEGIKRIIDGL